MKRFSLFAGLVLSASLVGCQKQQTDEERRAEVEREVQQRLATEHQKQQTQQLAQREADLAEREQAVSDQEKQADAVRARSTVIPERRVSPEVPATINRQPTASYSMFYTRLEPYGDWFETSDYGYVYRPREATSSRWRPYTNGHWVYTDAGWTWISDEPFGWATYHYGRWTRIRNVGWVWVPGDEWAPAWVSWRKGADYVGWAPLPPEARVDRRSGIRNWSDNYYGVGPDQYVFVARQQFGDQRVERAIVPPQHNVTIVNETTNVTNITYNNSVITNQGPSYEEMRSQSRQPIAQLRLERQVQVQVDNPRPVVRGEIVEMPAPVLAPAQLAERPRTVKETVAQVTVDLGWAAISDQHEIERTRAKIKAEATAPPDAPAKKFVRASEINAAGTQAPAATQAPSVTSSPQSTSTSPTATPVSTATSAPRSKMTSSVTVTVTPQATFTPYATAVPTSTPSETGTVSPETTRMASPSQSVSTPEPNRPDGSRAVTAPFNTAGAEFTPVPISTPSARASTATEFSPRGSTSEDAAPAMPRASTPQRHSATTFSPVRAAEKTRRPHSAVTAPSSTPSLRGMQTPDPSPTRSPEASPASESSATPTASAPTASQKSWSRNASGKGKKNVTRDSETPTGSPPTSPSASPSATPQK